MTSALSNSLEITNMHVQGLSWVFVKQYLNLYLNWELWACFHHHRPSQIQTKTIMIRKTKQQMFFFSQRDGFWYVFCHAPHVQTRSEFHDRQSRRYVLAKTSIRPCSRYHWMATTWLESNLHGWPMLLTYRWQDALYISPPPEATGSHWEGVVGQNVCPPLVNRWGLISDDTRCSS